MPMNAEALKKLKTAISAARKTEMNFALSMGKKPEGTVLLIERIKEPGVLLKQARRDGETPRLASGRVNVDGSKIILHCLDEPPAGAARRLKPFFAKTVGITLKVQLIDPDGNVLDDEDEEDGADSAPTAPSGGVVPDDPDLDDRQRWIGTYTTVNPMVEEFVAAGAGDVDGVKAAWDEVCAIARQGDMPAAFEAAEKMPGVIEAAKGAAGADPAPAGGVVPDDPDMTDHQRWIGTYKTVNPMVEEFVAAGAGDVDGVKAAWDEACAIARQGDMPAAFEAAEKIPGVIEAAKEEGTSATEDDGAQTRIDWDIYRDALKRKMSALEAELNAIIEEAEGDLIPATGAEA